MFINQEAYLGCSPRAHSPGRPSVFSYLISAHQPLTSFLGALCKEHALGAHV